jgi:hypothetical protein
METLIYFENGDVYKGQSIMTDKQIKKASLDAKAEGHIGYLKGYRYFDNQKDDVICYFTYKPDFAEINRRRLNGFKSARWHSL